MPTTDSEIIITRIFNAPRELIFKAWSDPERLKHRWGPKGFTWVSGKMDHRQNGIFHYGILSPNGHEMWGKFVYRDILPPELLTFIISFSDKECNILRHPFSTTWPLEVLNTLTFTEYEGKTIVVIKRIHINTTEEELKTFKTGPWEYSRVLKER